MKKDDKGPGLFQRAMQLAKDAANPKSTRPFLKEAPAKATAAPAPAKSPKPFLRSEPAKPAAAPAPVQPAKPAATAKTYKVTGLQYYMENIMALASENIAYEWSKRDLIDAWMTDERVYQYDFSAKVAELVPEPDNPHDPKAIKVVVDGQHVGYIKAGSCAHLHKVIRENRIERIDCEISGGKYKIVLENYDDMTGKSSYTMERDEAPIWVHLSILERDD